MEAKLVWLTLFVLLYAAFCIHRARDGASGIANLADHAIAGRTLGPWAFILAATATTFSGWTVLGHPALIHRDGLPYALASLYAVAIPFAGLLVMKRQWMVGKRFGHLTPGEMLGDYYRSDAARLAVLAVALCVAVPLLGLQLHAAGYLLFVLTDGRLPRDLGAWLMGALLMVYVPWGGLRGVARVAVAQGLLLVAGLVILGVVALTHVGGFGRLAEGVAALAGLDATRTPDGASHYLAVPGAVQWVGSATRAHGGVWTGAMLLTYMVALMGIQCSPAFSMWALASRDPRPFAFQQVWASSFVVGGVLVVFAVAQGLAGRLLGGDAAFAAAFPHLVDNVLGPLLQAKFGVDDLTLAPGGPLALTPLLIELMMATAPWVLGFLTVCALAAMHSTAAAHMSATGAMVARDIARYLRPGAAPSEQVLTARAAAVAILLAALATTSAAPDVVALASLALGLGAQMLPALLGLCYLRRLTGPGIVAGLVVGAGAVVATEGGAEALGLPWGRWPLTVHAAAWGLLANAATAVLVSIFTQDAAAGRRAEVHGFLAEHAGTSPARRRGLLVALVAAAAWFVLAVGPGAVLGNTLFGAPGDRDTWTFGVPSLWAWLALWWLLGVATIWWLAYRLGFSTPPARPVEPLSEVRDDRRPSADMG